MSMGIYKITNKLNNKIYIGKSKNVFKRWETHVIQLEKHKHNSTRFQAEYIELNMTPLDLKFEILEMVSNSHILSEIEEYWITYFESNNSDIGYNIMGNKDIKDFNDLLMGTDVDILNNEKIYKSLKDNLKIIGLESFQCGNKDSKSYKKYLSLKNAFSKKWFNNLSKEELEYVSVLFGNFMKNKSTNQSYLNMLWTCFYNKKDDIIKLKDTISNKKFVSLNTDEIKNKKQCLIYLSNLYVNTFEYKDYEKMDHDKYAIIMILTWIKNVSDINKPIELFLPSKRMKTLLVNYLDNFKS